MLIAIMIVVLAWSSLLVAGQMAPVVSNRFSAGIVAAVLAVIATLVTMHAETGAPDAARYEELYQRVAYAESPSLVDSQADALFLWFLWLLAKIPGFQANLLLGVVAGIVAVAYLYTSWRLLPPWAAQAAFLSLFASGWFLAYTAVALRQGLAIGCLLLTLPWLVSRHGKWWFYSLLLVSACLFHWSAIGPALVILGLRVFNPPLRVTVALWIVLAVAFAGGAQEALLGGLAQQLPGVAEYTDASAYANYGGLRGNRLDLMAASGAILLAAIILRRLVWQDTTYDRLINAYILMNAIFLLLGFVAFSDRIAAYSWFLAPIMLWYPIANAAKPTLASGSLLLIIGFGVSAGSFSVLATI